MRGRSFLGKYDVQSPPDGEFGVESVQASRQAGDSRIVIGLAGGKTLCLDENEYFYF